LSFSTDSEFFVVAIGCTIRMLNAMDVREADLERKDVIPAQQRKLGELASGKIFSCHNFTS
jgi:hypothetical protein